MIKILHFSSSKKLGIVVIFFSFVIACFVVFYNISDQSFNTSSGNITYNMFGHLGSYVADLFLQLFGIITFPLLLLFSYSGILLISERLNLLCFLNLLALKISIICCGTIIALWGFNSSVLPSIAGALPVIINNSIPLNVLHKTLIYIFIICICNFNILILLLKKVIRKEVKKESVKMPVQKIQKKASRGFEMPDIELLKKTPSSQDVKPSSLEQLNQTSKELLRVLNEFNINGKIIEIHQGPVVTLYEFEPAPGIKSSRIIAIADDVARSLSAFSTRISTIPGKNVLGIELPNDKRLFFNLREILLTPEYNSKDMILPLVLGKNISGKPYVVDLSKMPHLLVAGTTGSGKSVCINTLIVSLLYKYTPDECRFIMIDPKMLELSVYQDIPHLLTPVVTNGAGAVTSLKWAVREMERRYRLMSDVGVRNIVGYNAKLINMKTLSKKVQIGFDENTDEPEYKTLEVNLKKLPLIVVIVDEMADLMLTSGKDIEGSIQRLAQMARAAGIHLIMATQRPSVDVITGVIKANFPSRISFKVTSKIDSRTILGQMGAEQLLGMGDMLYMGNSSSINRVHGPFISDQEVESITAYLRSQGKPEYVEDVVIDSDEDEAASDISESDDEDSELYKQAVEVVKNDQRVSTSYIQRSLRIGYNRAAILVEKMEKQGIISSPNHAGKRQILIK
jgi:S-DNA-T family DNA segregation ATPase FtsK/SpoIIIE